jgi:hypothetical protein
VWHCAPSSFPARSGTVLVGLRSCDIKSIQKYVLSSFLKIFIDI